MQDNLRSPLVPVSISPSRKVSSCSP